MEPVEPQFCTECGKRSTSDDLFQYEDRRMCLSCKPAFEQRLRQGGATLPRQEYAGFWIRFVARVIDSLIIGVAELAVTALVGLAIKSRGPAISRHIGIAALIPLAFTIGLAVLYETGFLVRSGATPGKMLLNLKVITANGGPISWGRALARYLCYWLDSLTLLIGYIIAAFDSEKRALHDHICGTRVIRNPAVQAILSR